MAIRLIMTSHSELRIKDWNYYFAFETTRQKLELFKTLESELKFLKFELEIMIKPRMYQII